MMTFTAPVLPLDQSASDFRQMVVLHQAIALLLSDPKAYKAKSDEMDAWRKQVASAMKDLAGREAELQTASDALDARMVVVAKREAEVTQTAIDAAAEDCSKLVDAASSTAQQITADAVAAVRKAEADAARIAKDSAKAQAQAATDLETARAELADVQQRILDAKAAAAKAFAA